MNILITSAGERFSVRLAAALGKTHELRLTDRRRTPEGTPVVLSQLGDDESTDDLVKDIDVIVHWGKPDPGSSDSEQLDHAIVSTTLADSLPCLYLRTASGARRSLTRDAERWFCKLDWKDNGIRK